MKPTAFKRFCGVKPHTFATMLKALQQREDQKKKPGRAADLDLEDQLLLSLQYWRECRTYFHLSVSWGVSEATVCRIVNRIEDILIQAKHGRRLGLHVNLIASLYSIELKEPSALMARPPARLLCL